MAKLLTLPIARLMDANGTVYPGGKLYAYATGTTTPASVYTTNALNVAHANPVVADSGGFLPAIFLDPTATYRFVAKTSGGAAISGMDFDPVAAASAEDLDFAPTGVAPAVITSLQTKLEQIIALPDARQSNDDDENDALAELIDAGYRKILLPAGRGFGDGGNYLLGQPPGGSALVNLASHLSLIGDGDGNTVINRSSVTDQLIFYADSGSGDINDNFTDISFEGITFEDDPALGFAEHYNMIQLQGVTRVRIERCIFRGFRSDGITIEAETGLGVERHNQLVRVADCYFDGINRNNRNGISCNDCDGFYGQNLTFYRVTRTGDGTTGATSPSDPTVGLGMPGPICFEPPRVANHYRLRNAFLNNIWGKECGGINGVIALNLRPNNTLLVPHENFEIHNLNAIDCAAGFYAQGYANDDALYGQAPYNIKLIGGLIRGQLGEGPPKDPISLEGILDAEIDIAVIDCEGSLNIGTRANRNITIKPNLTRVGTTNIYGIVAHGSTQNVRIMGGETNDVGKPDGTSGGVLFLNAGNHDSLWLVDNIFESAPAFVGTGSIAGTTLTIATATSGTLRVGSVVAGTNVTSGSRITAMGTGVGGVGTYTVSVASTASLTAITASGATRQVAAVGGTATVNNATCRNSGNEVQFTPAAADSFVPGSFTGTLTGCTTSPTGAIRFSVSEDVVTLVIPAISGTSNTTAATLTGMPSNIWPDAAQACIGVATDSGTDKVSKLSIGTDGVITLYNALSATFTNSGTKGVGACVVSYKRTN